MFVVYNRLLLIVAGAGLEPAWRCGILGFFTVLVLPFYHVELTCRVSLLMRPHDGGETINLKSI